MGKTSVGQENCRAVGGVEKCRGRVVSRRVGEEWCRAMEEWCRVALRKSGVEQGWGGVV